MDWNLATNTPPYTLQTDAALHQIPKWNISYNNGSSEGTRYNISHFIEFQASVMIWRYVAPVVLVVGTIGSILSLLVLCRKSLRIQTTMFYLSALAITDLMVLYAGLVRLWLEHAENTYIRLSSRAACKLHNFFVYLSLDLSVWILVAVSVDRCLYVSWPQLAKKWCKLRNAHIIVSIITVLSALINVHFIWTYDLETHDSQHIYANGNKKCFADTSSSLTESFVLTIWPWIDFCVYCLFPFLFMATSNAIIIKQLLRTERNMASYQNFALEGGQKISAEQGQDRLEETSVSTSAGQSSDTDSETRANKRGQLNQEDDILQRSMSKLNREPKGDLPAVKVDDTLETDAQETQSQDVWLSDECTPTSLTVGKSVKHADSSAAFFEFKEYLTPKVKTIMSGNCQSLTAPNKRSSMKNQQNPELSGKPVLESQGAAFNILHAQTMPSDGESDIEPHLSLTYKASVESYPAESRVTIHSHFASGEIGIPCSQIQSEPIELAVLDELIVVVAPADLTASFHDVHVETKNLLPEIQTHSVDIRLPKSTERMRALTNKVHPLKHNHQATSTDMSSVSTRGSREATGAVPKALWIVNNNVKDRLVIGNQSDSGVTRSKLYELSHAEPVICNDCTPLHNNTEWISKARPVGIENIGTDVDNETHYYLENIGTDDDYKSLYYHRDIGIEEDSTSHYHHEKIGVEAVNKSHHHENTAGTIRSTSGVTSLAITQVISLPKKSLSPSKNKWQSTSTTSDTLATVPSRRNTSSVSKTLLAVTIMFWIFNAPIVIFIISQTYIITAADDRGRAVLILGWTLVNILQYMNNALHFFLYCLTGPKFRQELKGLCKECLALMKRVKSLVNQNN